MGALLGETIVVSNPTLVEDFAFHLKQRGGMLAKGRLLGIQFQVLFGDANLFFAMARHANAMAARLANGIASRGHALSAQTETNQIFPVLPNAIVAALQENFGFYVWGRADDEHSVIRLLTSWATSEDQVDTFLSCLVLAGQSNVA